MPSSRPSRDFRQSRQYARACRALGLRIRQLREAAALTLDAASGRADLDLAHWQKIEAGKVNVTLATLLRIANALDASLNALFVPSVAGESARAGRGRR